MMKDRIPKVVFLAATLLLAAHPAQSEDTDRTGDPVRGEEIYGRCKACHALDRDRTGPHHCGLFGRKAGSVEGFRYSRAMKNSNIVWTARTLDAFLRDSRIFIPKNRMGYAGIKDPHDRADVIAYLQKENRNPAVCP